MRDQSPSLDAKSLARLRDFMRASNARDGQTVPMRPLVELARDVALDNGAGVTIDFGATEHLGAPMVVLRVPAAAQADARLAALSPREREVAALVADGLANKQIAERLFISLATVKDHVHRILEKTGLPNRAAVAAAHRGSGPSTGN
jgi:DNA-binding CsgD family transcriptional regulator